MASPIPLLHYCCLPQLRHRRVTTSIAPIFPKDVLTPKGSADSELTSVTTKPDIAICTVDGCGVTGAVLTNVSCNLHSTISSAMGVRSGVPVTPCEFKTRGCLGWYTGDSHFCEVYSIPDTYTTAAGAEAQFFFYRCDDC